MNGKKRLTYVLTNAISNKSLPNKWFNSPLLASYLKHADDLIMWATSCDIKGAKRAQNDALAKPQTLIY